LMLCSGWMMFFFFQAEDGIRDFHVTGVQTCALPISEGQKGGEFYTPAPIVRLLTDVIEPYHGRILDPACGSGGMFVSSARFVAQRKKSPSAELAICGVEKTDETGRLCRLNLRSEERRVGKGRGER